MTSIPTTTENDAKMAALVAARPMLLSNAIQALQLGTLIVGLVLVAANMGAKGERLERHESDLKELKAITQELVKAQISIVKDNETQSNQIVVLVKLEDRIRALENNK